MSTVGDEKRKRALVMSRVNRVRRRLDLEVALRLFPAPLWVAATAFLIYRVGVRQHVLVAALVLLLVALVAVRILFASRRVGMDQAAVIADRLSGAQGLLLTRLEVPVGAWELGLNERLREVPVPKIEARRSGLLIASALAFWGIAALVPLPERLAPLRNAPGETRVEELAQKLEAVAREEPVGDAAQEVLDQLRSELEDGRFDAADWEAADALEAELDRKAMEAQAELQRAEEAARAYQQALNEGASGEAEAREREALESALLALSDGSAMSGSDALEQALREAGASKSGAQGKEGEQGQQGQQGQNGQQGQQGQEGQQGQQGQNGQQGKEGQQGQQGQNGQQGQSGKGPSRAQTQALKDALARRQQQLDKSMGQSGQSQRQASNRSGNRQGQQGQGQGQQSQQQGQGQGQGQGEGQGQGQGQGQNEGHASRGHGNQGGPSRGGGEGNLVFGGQAEIDPDRLAFAPLPEGQGGEAGELWGLQRSDPRKSGNTPRSGGSSGSTQGQSAPANREGELLPRNRALIQRYFDSKPSP